MIGLLTPIRFYLMYVIWFLFLWYSCAFASNIQKSREEMKHEFATKLDKLIDDRNFIELGSFVSKDVMVRYTFFEEMEMILVNRLELGDYEIVSVLLENGVIITCNLQGTLIKLVTEGEAKVLEKILEHQLVNVSVFCNYEELLKAAIEAGNSNTFDVLLSHENLVNQCSNQAVSRLAKSALIRGRREILELLLDCAEVPLKRMLLGSLLKLSAVPERFYVVQMCVDADISLKGVEREDMWHIAQIAANFGCEKTTKAIFKVFSAAAYIRNRLNLLDSPLMIARERGNEKIVELYEKFMT